VPTVLIARTDADSATLLTSNVDPADEEFLTAERSPEGFFHVRSGLEPAIKRSLAYAPYADVLWFETATPDMDEARRFVAGFDAVDPNYSVLESQNGGIRALDEPRNQQAVFWIADTLRTANALAMLERQSTSVPKTSKNRACTETGIEDLGLMPAVRVV
jgi:hypothetical protein